MVAPVLDERRINDGESLVKILDDSGSKVRAAFWLLAPDTEDWTLVISLPRLEAHGPRRAYGAIQKALAKVATDPSIALSDVTIASAKREFLKSLRGAIKTGSGLSRARFTNCVLSGQYIPDVLVYRMN